MSVKRMTLANAHSIAQSAGLIYRGSPNPKSYVDEKWECPSGHIFTAPPNQIKHRRSEGNGCPYCYGSSPKMNLAQSGKLGPFLAEANLELPEVYHGAKQRTLIRCVTCSSTWRENMIAILYQGNKCPSCYPRRHSNRFVTQRLQLNRPTFTCAAE